MNVDVDVVVEENSDKNSDSNNDIAALQLYCVACAADITVRISAGDGNVERYEFVEFSYL